MTIIAEDLDQITLKRVSGNTWAVKLRLSRPANDTDSGQTAPQLSCRSLRTSMELSGPTTLWGNL